MRECPLASTLKFGGGGSVVLGILNHVYRFFLKTLLVCFGSGRRSARLARAHTKTKVVEWDSFEWEHYNKVVEWDSLHSLHETLA